MKHEIIDDVKYVAESVYCIGVMNEQVIRKIPRKMIYVFKELFTANPHVFLSKHPLHKDIATFADLEPYPCLSLSREFIIFILPKRYIQSHRKNIYVSDRSDFI